MCFPHRSVHHRKPVSETGAGNRPRFFMKKVIIKEPTIIGGVFYEPSGIAQSAPDDVADHLCAIGNATMFESKVVEPTEKKSEPLSASQPAPVSPKRTARGRKPAKQKS